MEATGSSSRSICWPSGLKKQRQIWPTLCRGGEKEKKKMPGKFNNSNPTSILSFAASELELNSTIGVLLTDAGYEIGKEKERGSSSWAGRQAGNTVSPEN